MVDEIALGVSAATLVFGVFTYYRDSKRNAKKDTLEAYQLLQETTLSKINLWLPSEIRKAT